MPGGPFSVIIPHRDRPERLIESLRAWPPSFTGRVAELIIVDDASAPNRVPDLEACRRALSTAHSAAAGAMAPEIRLLHFAQPQGPAAARNRAAGEALSPLLVFLDDDAHPLEGPFDEIVRAFDAQPELAAIGLRIDLGGVQESGGAFNVFVGCGAVLRRSAYLSAGGFPSAIPFYAEEYALSWRLLAEGWRIRSWRDPAVRHHKETVGRDRSGIVARLIINNRRLLEPLASKSPRIRARLDELLAWYRVLAAREHGSAAAEQALFDPLPPAMSGEPRGGAEVWPGAIADRLVARWPEISGLERLTSCCHHWREAGLKRVALWPIGKDVETFRDELIRAGFEVIGVLDPTGRFGLGRFAELPVLTDPSERSGDAVIVASFSPGQNANGLEGRALAAARRVEAGFCFLDANAPGEREACRRTRVRD
jgi:GT2 family glycosyltransferase